MATVIKFRNYRPYDESLIATLRKHNLTNNGSNHDSTDTPSREDDDIESMAVEAVSTDGRSRVSSQRADSDNAPEIEDPILRELEACKAANSNEINIVPMKENSDLKQLAAGRLAKLRKRTNRAVVAILREKVRDTDDNDEE
jgi:hypothetical protein